MVSGFSSTFIGVTFAARVMDPYQQNQDGNDQMRPQPRCLLPTGTIFDAAIFKRALANRNPLRPLNGITSSISPMGGGIAGTQPSLTLFRREDIGGPQDRTQSPDRGQLPPIPLRDPRWHWQPTRYPYLPLAGNGGARHSRLCCDPTWPSTFPPTSEMSILVPPLNDPWCQRSQPSRCRDSRASDMCQNADSRPT